MTGTSWTIADYNAVPDPHGRPIPAAPIAAAIPAAIPAAPIPEEGETDEPTIEEGGTVVLCRGLFLFLCLVIFPRARIPIFPFPFSYCFDYFLFFISFTFLSGFRT